MAKNNKVFKEQNKYHNLLERYEEMNDFHYFREHAHEEYESDLPFSHLTL